MNPDSKFMRYALCVSNLFTINILCILCCVPIFTIGASVTAMYSITFKMIRDEEPPSIAKGFFRAFKENFAKSTLIWLIFVLFGVFLFFDLKIAYSLFEGMFRMILVAFFVAIAIMYLFALSYVFALVSAFDAKVKGYIFNAVRLSLAKIKYTILILLLNLSPCIGLFVPISQLKWIIMVLFFIWFAAVAYINTFIFRRIFAALSENK